MHMIERKHSEKSNNNLSWVSKGKKKIMSLLYILQIIKSGQLFDNGFLANIFENYILKF